MCWWWTEDVGVRGNALDLMVRRLRLVTVGVRTGGDGLWSKKRSVRRRISITDHEAVDDSEVDR